MTNEEIEKLKEVTEQALLILENTTLNQRDQLLWIEWLSSISPKTILSLIERVKAADKLYAALDATRGQWIHSISADRCLSALDEYRKASEGKCPPHSWDRSGERCTKCGDKDWMS